MFSSVIGALQNLGVPLPPPTPRHQYYGFLNIFSKFSLKADEGEGQAASKGGRPDKVLVGGGSGFVGQEVCLQLRKAGYEVIVISRTAGANRLKWEDITSKGIPAGTKAVINLAGQNVLDPFSRWSPEFKELCRTSRIETTKTLATAIKHAPEKPNVFVSMSGVGFYAPTKDGCDESGSQGSDWLADLAGDWEDASRGCGDGVRLVILRPGVVLGRTGGMINQIFMPFFFGLGGRMGDGTQPFPWVHVKDLAGLIKYAVETEKMEGVYNAVAPQMITNQKFVDTFASSLNRPAFIPLPAFVWNFVFGEERAVMITEGQKIRPRRTLEAGYNFRFPTIETATAEFSKLLYFDEDLRTH